MNRRLTSSRCLDCGATQPSCEMTRVMERQACCDRCEHGDLADPHTRRLKAQP